MSFSPSFVPYHWYNPTYIRPLASLIARFAVFFAILYRSTLSALLSRCIRLNHSFFSLIAFCTFLFHHHVSLASHLPPLVTPNSSDATFLMQVAIPIRMLFASPPCQGPFLRTLSLNVFTASFLSFYHFVLGAWTCLLCWKSENLVPQAYVEARHTLQVSPYNLSKRSRYPPLLGSYSHTQNLHAPHQNLL
jgi:hypothetical protein